MTNETQKIITTAEHNLQLYREHKNNWGVWFYDLSDDLNRLKKLKRPDEHVQELIAEFEFEQRQFAAKGEKQ